MKSNTKKRLIAFMLCMVLVLSSATSVFADEPQNTDSQSQTEAVTEPAADEATGDEAAVNSSEQQQQQEEQQPETESAPEGNLENDISIQTTINGTTITMSGPYSSFPEGSNYEILASELNEEETKNVEVALKKKEDEINTKIATYKAYDIKLLVDGIESQPTGNVNVKFEGGEVQENLETAENIEVYHVDETTQIANDIEKTAVDDTVTMTTNHFSTYVITTTKPEGVDITVQHYIKYTDSNNQPAEKALYRDSKIHLNENQVITDLSSLQNYTSQEVIKIDADGSKGEQISNNQVITADQTYRVYYTPTTATSNEDVQMFDYQVKGENNTSINAEKNYDQRSTKTTRFASGLANKQHSGNGYDTTIKINDQNIYINTWDTNSENTRVNQYNNTVFGFSNAMTGIVKGVDFNTGELKMGVNSDREQLYEPGFFTKDEKIGKQVLANYKLNFSRTGDTYTLTGVSKPDGTPALSGYDSNKGSDFFPLDSIRDLHKDEANDPGHRNCFFGMRYDIEFTIGDYLGDLNYSFTGDDDLWAILDAKENGGQVVIDLGGIHSALDKKVDLWEILLNKKDPKEEDKLKYADRDKKHTLTILYMERGAYESNCKMNFTLPNSRIVTPSTIPTADLNLKKVNTSEGGIANTTFNLVNDKNSEDIKIATSNPDGNITFEELREGTYTLSEKSVPEPYVRETSTWKVKVTKSEGTALTAVLYDTTGETAKEKNADGTYHIVNSTQEEVVLGSAESNKTVAVKNYKTRTYQIDLTASSKATQAVTTTTPYDIVMVLDTSGSMSDTFYKYTEYTGNLNSKESYYIKTDDKIYQKIKYSDGGWGEESYWYYKNTDETEVRVTQETNTIYTRAKDSTTNNKNAALKAAAKAFVENVNTKNPDSRIGIVTFASGSTINNSIGKTMLRVGDSKATIDKWIDDLGANGATNTAAGFKSAKNIFDNSSNWEDVRQNQNRKKLIVFLTDGVPTKSSDFNETVATSTVNTAITLKGASYNAEIYSLGIFDAANYTGSLGNKANIKKVSKFMKDVASDDSKYMTADSVQSLYDIFNSITDNMPVSITATITDVIDSRFELTTGEKERLEGRGATVSENDDGTTTVTWTNTTVKSKTGNTPGWHETIEIKAKDNFIGGNMIPTNGPASGITVGDNTKYFPQPSVNVKLLTPSIGDKEITYYKGDTIESSKFSRELLGTYKMTELDTTTAVEKGIPKLTEEQLTKLKNGETVEIPYSYTNLNTDIEGTFVYEYKNTKYDTENTTVNSLEDHTATKVGKDVEEYTLTVVFVPKTVDERKTLLNDTAVLEPNGNANISGTVVTNASVTGTYKVHVLALWAIVKQSTSADSDGNHPMLSGAKFELLKGSTVCYTGESNSDGFVEWYKAEKKVSLSEMVKDTYTLRETSAPAGYAKSEVQWTIQITDTSVTIKDANGNNITPTPLTNIGKTYDAYTYENTPVYALPSAGGTGIYLYMIGGMLLMFAAVWILYKSKCKEVLGK
ncbi:VWA domain-containing protein [Coprococcus comes]|uniref:VWA domain-containing protein n=1 Tax=Coprococcus comes TaxID=410072 RepID=A0A3E4GP42_9FIRM|nr:SpaA isopeptide-forming pilin-related protein [Coprococcus comes]RGJ22664.1 VWA domain-containing protein [Coprococcus comes]